MPLIRAWRFKSSHPHSFVLRRTVLRPYRLVELVMSCKLARRAFALKKLAENRRPFNCVLIYLLVELIVRWPLLADSGTFERAGVPILRTVQNQLRQKQPPNTSRGG